MTRLLTTLLAVLAAGCGSSPSSPTSTSSTTASPLLENYETTLAAGDATFYAFSMSAGGLVTVTLASIVHIPGFSAVPIRLRIGVGTPHGEGCEVSESVEVPPALTPQISTTLAAGIHCVSVADIGEVTDTVIASIRFKHP